MFIGQCNKPATATGSDSKVVKKNIQTSRLLLWNDRLLLLGLMIKHFTWMYLKITVLNQNKTFLLTAWISKKKLNKKILTHTSTFIRSSTEYKKSKRLTVHLKR